MTTKKPESDDLSAVDADLGTASQVLDKYRRSTNADLKLPVTDYKVRRDDATMAQSALQYEIDYETNEMQQDMVTMQSLVDRRDESYSTATNLMTSISDTRANVIRNM